MSAAPDLANGRLARLASWCYRRRRTVVALWALAFVAVTAVSASAGGAHRADYSMPGSESAAVRDVLRTRFADRPGDPVFVVARSDRPIADPAVGERLTDLGAALAGMDHVAAVGEPVTSPDGHSALMTVVLDDRAEAVPVEAVEALIDRTVGTSAEGLQVELGGWPVQYAEQGAAGKEGIGLVAALVILLVAFGSALAAGIPIVLALVGLGVGSGIAMLVANLVDVPEWGSMLAAMIGIGVGIDYALFIVTRYRNALAAGSDPHGAVVEAMTTSGRAVLFAGGTVVVSLLGLGITGLEYMWGAAVAMVLGVVGVLAAATTLLPAVLGFTGRHIDRFRLPGTRGHVGRSAGWASWSRRVQRRPLIAGVIATAVLLALAAPVLGLRFGFPDAGSNPTSTTSRRAYDLTSEAFGPGANGPLVVAIDAPSGSAVLLTVVPTTGPQDVTTERLVRHLRSDVVPDALAGLPTIPGDTDTPGDVSADVSVMVGGLTALFVDEADYEASRLPWFIGAVLLLSFVLLMMVFRAPLVALKAAVLNLLGISAAYGVIALAVQGGWFGGLLGIDEPTPVPVFVPILMFALLFGLSMDYEVFLLSRIREEHLQGATNSDAVVEGIAGTARVITAAAAIMVVVFGAFVLNDEVIAKLAGLGLATAVLLDATLVRMVLVPATMELLGERNWWIPRWLDVRLPRFDVEPAAPAVAPEIAAATR